MKINVNHLTNNNGVLHGVIMDEDYILEIIENIHGNKEVNRIINLANSGPFHEFMSFHNFTGLLTCHNQQLQLNFFEFDSLDVVFDHFLEFNEKEWSDVDKQTFTALAHNSFNSQVKITLIKT